MNEQTAIARLADHMDQVKQDVYSAGMDRIGTIAAVGSGVVDVRIGQATDEDSIVMPGVKHAFGATYAVGQVVYFRQFGTSRYTPGSGDCVVIFRLS